MRMRRAGLTSLTAVAAQGATIVTGLISVPLTVDYLGQERYGVWLTLSSLLTWLAIADLGFGGNALINAVAEARGLEDRSWARELTSTAFWFLTAIAVALGMFLAMALQFVPLAAIFNVSETVSRDELQAAVVIGVAGFLLSLPTGAAAGVFHGFQEGYVSHAWGIAGSVLSLAALYGVTRFEGGLPELVLALWGARCLMSIGAALHLFVWRRRWLLPSPAWCTLRALRRLKSLGIRYLVVQLAGIGMFQSQPIIIAQTLGPAQVGLFNVAQRIITLPLLFIQLLTTPLMPAYAEAYTRHDWAWIRRTLRRSFWATVIGGALLVVAFVFLARPLIRLWVGAALVPEWPLVLALSAYAFIVAAATPASVTLFGIGRVGKQALFASLNALLTVGLGLVLTRGFGPLGMAWAMTIAFAAVNPAAQWMELRRSGVLAARD